MSSAKRQHIVRLIKEYSRNSGTEALIGFVADTSGMLAACQSLLKSIDAEDTEYTEWLLRECNGHDVELHSFLGEIQRIGGLFHPGQKLGDHYATLGVPTGAGFDEIKKAYRRLSLRYHPDTASPGESNYQEKFIEITRAYHSLLAVGQNNLGDDRTISEPHVKSWRRKKERTVSTKQRKNMFGWTLGLLIVLVVVSIIATINHRRRAMIAGLQEIQSDSLIPAAVSAEESSEKPSPPETIEEKSIVLSAEENVAEQVEIADADITDSDTKISDNQLPQEEVDLASVVVKSEKTVNTPPPAAAIEIEADIDTTVAMPEPQEQETPLPESKPLVADAGEEGTVNEPEKNLQETDFGLQVDTFIADYIKAYEQRNLILFSRLFEADAMENGEPFSSMLPTYIDLFAATSELNLKVDIISWQKSDGGIVVRGRFKVTLQYKDSRKVSGSGPIRFLLNDSGDGFRIINLEYDFNVE